MMDYAARAFSPFHIPCIGNISKRGVYSIDYLFHNETGRLFMEPNFFEKKESSTIASWLCFMLSNEQNKAGRQNKLISEEVFFFIRHAKGT